MPPVSNRLSNLPPYVFSVIGDRLRQMREDGIDVYRLDIGNPDMPPPDTVIEQLAESASQPVHHGYTGYRGLASFRQAVSRYYHKRFGVTVDPDTQVLPLIGTKEGIVNLALAYLDRGDVALVPDIGYPSYAMGTRLAGGEVHWIPLRPNNGFLPDLDSIPDHIAAKARILWVNYPNNPTGAVAGPETYQALVAYCRQHDILLASDNPYVDVTYDGYKAISVLQADPELTTSLEFMSLSKTYNMAGWRLGAAVGSAAAIEALLNIKSNIDSGHFQAIYDAGSKALDDVPQSWLESRNAVYAKRREHIMTALPYIGLEAAMPRGTLYVWAKIKEGTEADYVENALKQAHVSLAPGSAYGPGGQGYVRISLAVPDDRLDAALESLKSWYAVVAP
ncbi:aminotransferase class I/II-fold pyridoxal phosphate-dependent enzyme [bacterium]|nr:aminotransferase class I/II-fold pyridoxal phosphate-dependent enzyme [bacterium]